MKKTAFILFVSLISIFSINAQSKDTPEQIKALNEITNLNNQVITLFKEKNYDEALKVALNIPTIAEKNGLSNDLRVLKALANLAEVYLTKGEETEALATYQKILTAYQSNSGDTRLPVAKTLERIAIVYFAKENYGKAEDYFLKALPLREKLNGAQSRETAYLNTAMGDIYRKKKEYQKASEFYLKALEINDKILSKEEKEEREDVSNYECFLYHKALNEGKIKEIARIIKEFQDSRKSPDAEKRMLDSGIVNGKAINLVKPSYPMKMIGSEGFVMVRVTIDEEGTVISAKATCGISEFVEIVEKAARKSKFSPTLVDGQAVKVTGIIVYSFVKG